MHPLRKFITSNVARYVLWRRCHRAPVAKLYNERRWKRGVSVLLDDETQRWVVPQDTATPTLTIMHSERAASPALSHILQSSPPPQHTTARDIGLGCNVLVKNNHSQICYLIRDDDQLIQPWL